MTTMSDQKFNLSDVKASLLDLLEDWSKPAGPAITAEVQQVYWERQRVTVVHRGFTYYMGRWADWNGPYYVCEHGTGIIYKGSLTDCKNYLKLCSDVAVEVRTDHENALKLTLKEAEGLRILLGSHCTVGLLAHMGLAELNERLGKLPGLGSMTTLGTFKDIKVHAEGPYPVLYHQRDSK
jgi:hypothetical protein